MSALAAEQRDLLCALLADLKMPGSLQVVGEVLTQLDNGTITATEAIVRLLKAQVALRNNRRLDNAMRASRLPAIKTLAEFDFSFLPSIQREQIESLHKLEFLTRRENVVFLGPSGVGKTHLAISLAIVAAESGRRIYFGTLAQLIGSLEQAKAERQLPRRMKFLTQPALLVVDEMGYLPVSRDGAALFFQLVNARHEHASTIITTNKAFQEWAAIFGDVDMTAAMLDRLLHHCHIVNIKGDSYRMRGHREVLEAMQKEGRDSGGRIIKQ